MTKRAVCLLMLLALLLPMAAQAGFPPDNESDWNKTVKYRTTRSTTLYSHEYTQSRWHTQEEEEAISVFTPIGTLPAGKYVNVISHELCGKREVFYWDGGQRSAWIDVDAYTRDTVQITSTTGRKTSIPRNAYGDAAAVRYILSEFLSGDEVESFVDGMRGGTSGGGSSAGSASGSATSGGSSSGGTSGGGLLALPAITLTETAAEGAAVDMEVSVVQAGLLHSVVAADGKEQTVLTAALSWERGEAEHALAIIYAPRGGTATLWQKSTGRNAICKLKAGSVVLVLEKGGKYTKVLGEGKVGYVITSALTLTDPVEDGEECVTARKVTMRLEARAKGRALLTIPKGTAVTVLGTEGNWALITYGGLTGYVEAKYLDEVE